MSYQQSAFSFQPPDVGAGRHARPVPPTVPSVYMVLGRLVRRPLRHWCANSNLLMADS